MDEAFKKEVAHVIDTDFEMDVWDGPPSIHAFWRDESGATASTDLKVPNVLWEMAPPAVIVYQLVNFMAASTPIPEGLALAVLDDRQFLGVALYTEAWGLSVNPQAGETIENRRRGIQNLSEHPDAYEFKAAVSVGLDGENYFYQRSRKEMPTPDSPDNGAMQGVVPLALEALVRMIDYARSSGKVFGI